jgi:hypothetical protein
MFKDYVQMSQECPEEIEVYLPQAMSFAFYSPFVPVGFIKAKTFMSLDSNFIK